LIVALDYDRLDAALALARRLLGTISIFKVGSQLFTAEGPKAVENLADLGGRVFLDLKFHDIPKAVTGALMAAAALPGVDLLTVHALGGFKMLRAAAAAVANSERRPMLLAVTILTSLDVAAVRQIGVAAPPSRWAVQLAQAAQQAGLDGVVTSAHEGPAIRRACGKGFLLVVPAIRPHRAGRGDQARVATPADAIRAGADYLVVGRPITAARDPRAAATRMIREMLRAFHSRI